MCYYGEVAPRGLQCDSNYDSHTLVTNSQELDFATNQGSFPEPSQAETPPEDLSSDGVFCNWLECYCVKWLREAKGYDIKGDAHTLEPNIDTPVIGSIVLIRYDNGVHHAGYIKYMLPSGKAFVMESANEKPGIVTESIWTIDDPRIRGYRFVNPNSD